MPDDAAWAEHVVVPDDLRELHDDIEAYHREQRALRRARRWRWLTGSRTWQRWRFGFGMISGAFALAAVLVVLLALSGTTMKPARLAAAPLAAPTHPPGARGGLLPDASLAPSPAGSGSTAHQSARALRPGVVALVPLACRCADVLAALEHEAAEVGVHLHVVAPADHDAEVSALPGRLHAVQTWFDARATLATAYAATGVTVLVVDPDGVVSYVQRDTSVGLARTLPVQQLLLLPPY